MNKTAIQKILDAIKKHPEESKDSEWLISMCEDAMAEEREQIVSAWIKGNEEGWYMSTDWPEHGERYYEQTYPLKQTRKLNAP